MAKVYPDRAYIADGAVAGLNGQTITRAGTPHIAKGTSLVHVPTLETWARRWLELQADNDARLALALGVYAEKTALKYGVYPGIFNVAGVDKTYNGSTGNSATNNATTYVWLDSTGALQTSTSAFPADRSSFLPLAEITAASGAITDVTDRRPWTAFRVPKITSVDAGTLAITAGVLAVNNPLFPVMDTTARNTLTPATHVGMIIYNSDTHRLEVVSGSPAAWGALGAAPPDGANISLSNLSAVAMNLSPLPASAGAIDVGSATKPFGSLFANVAVAFVGASHNLSVGFVAPTAARAINFPDASGTVMLAEYTPAIPVGGDLDGTVAGATVVAIQGVSVSADPPSDGYVPVYRVATDQIGWEAQTGAGRAATDLSNIAATAFGADILPGAANTYDVGSPAKPLADVTLAGYVEIQKMAAPSNPAANTLRLYCADSGGTSKLYAKDSVGTVKDLYAAATALVNLTDCPASFSGQAGKVLAVNSTPNAVEFVACTGTGSVVRNTSPTFSGDVILGSSGTPVTIARETSDAADSKLLYLAGGGGANTGRGAVIELAGNEHADTGKIILASGDVSGSLIDFQPRGTSRATLDAANFACAAAGGLALGKDNLGWAAMFLNKQTSDPGAATLGTCELYFYDDGKSLLLKARTSTGITTVATLS